MFIPWMVIYLPAILSLLIFCCIKFWSMEGKQLAAILLVGVSAYFYAIVVASYIELKLSKRLKKVQVSYQYSKPRNLSAADNSDNSLEHFY